MAWYSCPFEKDHAYRVKLDITELGHSFATGEIVLFSDHSYDPKLGVIRFWFREATSNELKSWHVWEREMDSLDRWKETFEPQ
jgi:hypothetical protein